MASADDAPRIIYRANAAREWRRIEKDKQVDLSYTPTQLRGKGGGGGFRSSGRVHRHDLEGLVSGLGLQVELMCTLSGDPLSSWRDSTVQ